jgi:Uma2 family endonuclease
MSVTAVLTSDQFSALPDLFDKNGNRIRQELISGELVEMPPSFELHVTSNDTLVPDASIIYQARLSPRKQKYTPGAPELAIEVVSPNDKVIHLKSKVDIHLQGGSKTVWVVFPDSRSVMIHSRDSVRELKGDQTIEDPLLPGFVAPISRFFDLT